MLSFISLAKTSPAAMPTMLTETSLTAEDFAIMSSMFYILYGAMKFVGGMLVDKINPKAMTGPGADWRGYRQYSVRLFR
ncbi:transport protein [Salmonella bongori]|nr:transport protein [Salmonella bongori]